MRAFEVEVIAFDSADAITSQAEVLAEGVAPAAGRAEPDGASTLGAEAVVRQMRGMASAAVDAGWVNVRPRLSDEQLDEQPRATLPGMWFSARGPAVPMATWTPPASGRKPGPAVVGIEHGAGPRALEQLGEAGVPLPRAWNSRQDHPKRGIVAEVPAVVSCHETLVWLLSACRALCSIDLDSRWIAEVHRPRNP